MIANPYYGRDPLNVPDRYLRPGTVTSVESLEYLAPIKRIAWGAVLAGVVLAIGIQLLLNMLGTGIGASTIDPLSGDTPNAEFSGISAAMWCILSSLIALFIGGWTAARLAGIPCQVDGMLHGLLAWGLSTLVVFYLLGTVVGSLIGGHLISIAAVAPQVADAVASEAVASEVDREEVVNELMAQADMSREEATHTVDNWIGTYQCATVEANEQAADAVVAKASFWGFLALLIGAAAAGCGGIIGTPRKPVVARTLIAP